MRKDYYSLNVWVDSVLSVYPVEDNMGMLVEELNEALIEMNCQSMENTSWLEEYYYESNLDWLDRVLPMTMNELNEEWRRMSGLADKDAAEVNPKSEMVFSKAS